MPQKETIKRILDVIRTQLPQKSCVTGFDGYIDQITRPVKDRGPGKKRYFHKATDFAGYLTGLDNMSCSVELDLLDTRPGGNNPIMSRAVSRLGCKTSSVGAYGCGEIEKTFGGLAKECALYPVARPGRCVSLEFSHNKIMTYINIPKEELTYENLCKRVGREKLAELFAGADLISLVNCGELPFVMDIWEGLLGGVLQKSATKKLFLFDLSDCSRLRPGEMRKMLRLVERFSAYGKTCVSMNDNEFFHCYKMLAGERNPQKLLRLLSGGGKGREETGRYVGELYRKFRCGCLVLRTLHSFYAFDGDACRCVGNLVVEKPRLLTGAGDNQNAGIGCALLCGLPVGEALLLGSLVGSYYARFGESPTVSGLEGYLEHPGIQKYFDNYLMN